MKNELLGLIIARGLTQKEVANKLGITPNTFYAKMSKGIFGSNEIEKMIDLLKINDPAYIFFGIKVTQ